MKYGCLLLVIECSIHMFTFVNINIYTYLNTNMNGCDYISDVLQLYHIATKIENIYIHMCISRIYYVSHIFGVIALLGNLLLYSVASSPTLQLWKSRTTTGISF